MLNVYFDSFLSFFVIFVILQNDIVSIEAA